MTAVVDRSAPRTTTTASPRPDASRPKWSAFAVVLAAMILNLLDSTIVNVGAPSIQRDLALTSAQLEWIAAGYTLALAVGLLTGGRLGDMFGRKRMLLAGLAGFIVASAGCSMAWSGDALITARVVQGLCAALLVPQCFGLIRDIFPPAEMSKAFGALGPVIGLSTVAGPVVSGLLIRADLFGSGWRALFLINLPIGAAALIAGSRLLPSSAARRDGLRLDPAGTALMALVSFLVVFPLVEGRALGWPVWIFALLAAAAPIVVLFARQQRGRVRSGRSPLIELSLLRKRSYLSGVLFTLVFFGTVVGFSLTNGLYLQIVLGRSPMTASLYGVAIAVGAFLGSGVGAWATSAIGRPILHVGLTIMAAGTVTLYLCLRAAQHGVGALQLVPGMALFGLGMGMIFVPLFSIIMGDIEDHEVGSASGLLESLQQLGASVGVAVLATVFFGALHRGGGTEPGNGPHIAVVQHTLFATLVLIAVAFALGWLLPRRAREQH